jgi:hypothetical protein
LSYYLNGSNWDTVFERLAYNPFALGKLLKPGSTRKNCVVWDDVQATAPAEQGVPKAIRRLANFLSTERPEVACLIFTTPNINQISSPLRKLVNFEVIVSERGLYEVHKIMYRKNFKKPLVDLSRLEYMEELDQTCPFPPLSQTNQERYDAWRVKEKIKLYPALKADLDLYIKAREFQDDDAIKEQLACINTKVVKMAGRYMIPVPEELGKAIHMQRIKVAVTA